VTSTGSQPTRWCRWVPTSVLGVPVPRALLERGRRDGVFGVIGRLRYRGGRREAAILGLAHPGAAWLEWIEASEDDQMW
jgi:hypothetical protein